MISLNLLNNNNKVYLFYSDILYIVQEDKGTRIIIRANYKIEICVTQKAELIYKMALK